MEAKLVVVNGKNAGRKLKVTGPKFLIGRAEDCQLRPRSDAISRHHCAILLDDGLIAVRDLGSRNGTFVNGERIRTEAELKNGDRLTVGGLEFEVQWTAQAAAAKKSEAQSVQKAAARAVPVSASLEEEDANLDEWLFGGTEADVAETADKEKTRSGKVSPTGPSEQTQKIQASDDTVTMKKPATETTEPGVKVPGSWSKKPTTASTRDAAGEALRNFFRGR